MSLHTQLPIHKTGSDLLGLAATIHAQLPRGFKRTIGDKIVSHCSEMLDLMALGVRHWDEPSGTVTGNGRPMTGSFSVADPRQALYSAGYGVTPWDDPSSAVAAESLPSNGRFAVADPRATEGALQYQQYGVLDWTESMGAVIGVKSPGQGTFSVADPRRPEGQSAFSKYAVTAWGARTGTVIGGDDSGAYAVSDPRHAGPAKHSNEFRIVPWTEHSCAVTSAHGTGQAVADPRQAEPSFGKYAVTGFDAPAGTVISGSTTGQGAYAVADPRSGMDRRKGDNYLTGGHYGVVPWTDPTGAVSASAGLDNGRWSVADPRMPTVTEKLVCRIRSLDGTWHRPFTTLELAALQSLVEPEEQLELDGLSDQAWRERIGNAVPPDAAQAIAEVMGTTLLLAWSGETFMLSAQPIWVQPVAVALSVRGSV